MDTLLFHYDLSIFKGLKNQQWWNPNISHLNKYKLRKSKNGPRFFGSTTFLVFITDAWHFFQEIFLFCLISSILIAINIGIGFQWWYWIIGYIIIKIIMGFVFELFYSKIFKKY
jgi:hypothetical protein